MRLREDLCCPAPHRPNADLGGPGSRRGSGHVRRFCPLRGAPGGVWGCVSARRWGAGAASARGHRALGSGVRGCRNHSLSTSCVPVLAASRRLSGHGGQEARGWGQGRDPTPHLGDLLTAEGGPQVPCCHQGAPGKGPVTGPRVLQVPTAPSGAAKPEARVLGPHTGRCCGGGAGPRAQKPASVSPAAGGRGPPCACRTRPGCCIKWPWGGEARGRGKGVTAPVCAGDSGAERQGGLSRATQLGSGGAGHRPGPRVCERPSGAPSTFRCWNHHPHFADGGAEAPRAWKPTAGHGPGRVRELPVLFASWAGGSRQLRR